MLIRASQHKFRSKKNASGWTRRHFFAIGWGTRIRTLTDGVRDRSPTVRRFPNIRTIHRMLVSTRQTDT